MKELSFFDIVCEGDAELIIKALLARDVHHSEYGHNIQDSLILAYEFQVCKFTHVKCVGNTVAHFLARWSKLGNKLLVWIESIPDDITPLVTRDAL